MEIRDDDDYIKSDRAEKRLGLPVGMTPTDEQLRISADAALDAAYHLDGLDWRRGLMRDEIRACYQGLPLGIYLRLPDSKLYTSMEAVLHEAGLAPSRAEGDFMGASPNLPDQESLENGGPPGWGLQPLIYSAHATLDSGSAEDRELLLPDDDQAT
jgi:hypothetical protein